MSKCAVGVAPIAVNFTPFVEEAMANQFKFVGALLCAQLSPAERVVQIPPSAAAATLLPSEDVASANQVAEGAPVGIHEVPALVEAYNCPVEEAM
jgi:hypothetical protein